MRGLKWRIHRLNLSEPSHVFLPSPCQQTGTGKTVQSLHARVLSLSFAKIRLQTGSETEVQDKQVVMLQLGTLTGDVQRRVVCNCRGEKRDSIGSDLSFVEAFCKS